jgi:uncharacterized protein
MTRIGVVSDTHCPERVPFSILPHITHQLSGCDYILHAGDIESQVVLDTLSTVAPVYAVRGDDEIDTHYLPEKRIVEIDGIRIGIHHSHRPFREELLSRLKSLLGLHKGPTWGGVQEWLLRTFKNDDVQIIVFGHFHRPYSEFHKGILLLNPGSIYKMSFDALTYRINHTASKTRRITARLERRMLKSDRIIHPPTVALIQIENQQFSTEVISLPYVDYDVTSDNL